MTIQEDLEKILETGVTQTARVIELLKMRGWKDDAIVPIIYRTLLKDRVNPNGNKMPFKTN